MTDSLRPSVVYGGITIARLMRLRQMQQADAIAYVRQGDAQVTGYDYGAAETLAQEFGWRVFSHDLDPETAFCETIENWMIVAQPVWRDLLPLGRTRTLVVLSPNMVACFENAGLLGHEPATHAWWDHAASLARQAINERLLNFGRVAERWTYEREVGLLAGSGLTPVWVSIEDNGAGYDIRSFRPSEDPSGLLASGWLEIFIEVKHAGALTIHMSEREWRFALQHADSWELHVWAKGLDEAVVFSSQDVAPHVPDNRGGGAWETVEIRLAALSEAFEVRNDEVSIAGPASDRTTTMAAS